MNVSGKLHAQASLPLEERVHGSPKMGSWVGRTRFPKNGKLGRPQSQGRI